MKTIGDLTDENVRLRDALETIMRETSPDSEVHRQARAALAGGSVRGPLPIVSVGNGGLEVTADERGALNERRGT